MLICIKSSVGYPHPLGQGAITFKNVGPSVYIAFSAFSYKSLKLVIARVCATYGKWCDTIISVKSFLSCALPGITVPAGEVVVSANLGVAEERWIPVFIYAPLS